MNLSMASFGISPEIVAVLQAVDAFERADDSSRENVRSFLKDVPSSHLNEALGEIISVDFERRWSTSRRRRVKDYLNVFPELLHSKDALLRLLQREFSYRSEAGEQPSVAEYQSVYADFTPEGSTILRQSSVYSDFIQTTGTNGATPGTQESPRYTILGVLGEGTFGVVYKARDEVMKRYVALKVSKRSKQGLTKEQLHEATSISSLGHAGIVRVWDVGEMPDGRGFISQEFVDGKSLANRMEAKDFTLPQAAEWIAKIAEALHYAHSQNPEVVHRDLKPANVLIDSSDQPRIVDFGLAQRDGGFYMRDKGALVGTVAYMSPEQARRDGQWCCAQSDLYSLGVMLYELLCEKPPFAARELDDLLDEIQRRTPPAPSSRTTKPVPKSLETICLKAIAKDPADRYRNGAEMAADIRAAMRPPQVAPQESNNPTHSNTSWIQIGALSVAAASLGLLFFLWGGQPTKTPEVKRMGIAVTDVGPLNEVKRPLTSQDSIEVSARFDQPVFGYAIRYEQDGAAAPIWIANDQPAGEKQRDRIPAQVITLPDSDGATLIIAIASQRELTQTEIEELLRLEFTLSTPPEEAAHKKPYYCKMEYNSPDFILDKDVVRGELAMSPPVEFKKKLESLSAAYGGYIVSHEKQSAKAQE